MKIEHLTSTNGAAEEYIRSAADGKIYHLPAIQQLIQETFGHETFYLQALEAGEVCGVLPLVHMKNRIFGNFIISVPFFNYGGVCASNASVRNELLEEAIAITRKQQASHLELRHVDRHFENLPGKSHKVAMILDLPETEELLWESFKSKLRSQIRKPEKEGLTIRIGKEELLEDYYKIFSVNMRDLGTPVYSIKLFANMLRYFPQNAWIVAAYKENVAVAAGFVLGFGDTMEIPWASSLREYNRLAGNMMMYWHSLKLAIDQGYKKFDFGRSTPNEGTYKFKAQWGAEPLPLNWEYWLADGDQMPDISPNNAKYQAAIKIWQKIPLPITKFLGPAIVKNIP
ncbi:MAG: FemAB family PEP-CTERM system-associated protein [Deferribacteres bacterium]|nr:FemAB family PEP-CTERM system-associated protein [candidate division KSB1 bacterium]MCB9501799.1 FemAB family PEP-CTERM system-associated protein [Deferribacteres bacterium]